MSKFLSFDTHFDQCSQQFTLIQMPQSLIDQLAQQKIARICAHSQQDDCHLVTDTQIYQLKRTQNQNITLIGQVIGQENIILKSNTQTILCVVPETPKFHLIYDYLKPLALNTFEIDLEEIYRADLMFDFSTLMKKFVISYDQLESFFKRLSCLEYKNKFYFFDDMTHVNLLRYVILVLTEKKLQSFRIEDLDIQDKLMEKFITSSLEFHELSNKDGLFQISTIVVARSIISELVNQKGDYNFGDLWEAFWMMIPTFSEEQTFLITKKLFNLEGSKPSEVDIPQSIYDKQEQFFHEATKLQTIIVDTNMYLKPVKDLSGFIVKKVDKLSLSMDPLERIQQISKIQNKFLFEEIQGWLKDAGRSDKQISEFVQKNLKTSNEQIHSQNTEKLIKVYPFLDSSNLKFLKFYMLK